MGLLLDGMDVSYVRIFFDGSAEQVRGGKAAYGWVIYKNGMRMMGESGALESEETNNEAEYCAMISGLEAAKALGYTSDQVEVIGDSQLVINQMDGLWRIRAQNLRPLWEQAQELIRHFEDVRFRWIPEDENDEAHSLATDGLKMARKLEGWEHGAG